VTLPRVLLVGAVGMLVVVMAFSLAYAVAALWEDARAQRW
jgi:hypothetical protein